jgi:type IX secretion system PorP/SprF family membrane protein
MKKLQKIIAALLLVTSSNALAQQESVITFYKDHLNLINPAAVGVSEETAVTSTIRKQWTGIADAPETQAVSFMTPLNKNLAIGVAVVRDQVFIEKQTFIAVDFSYKVQLNDALALFMGIKAGGNNYEVNTNGLETYNVQKDPSLQPISRFNPNIGVGFYLKHQDYFVSLSTPKMLDTKRAKEENGFASAATDQAHYYLSAGRSFELSPSLDLVPSIIVRYVNGAPFSTDFTATTILNKKFDFGVTYRTDQSFAAMVKLNISKKVQLGFANEYMMRTGLLARANSSNELFLKFIL